MGFCNMGRKHPALAKASFVSALLIAAHPVHGAAAEYRLGPQDRIHLAVYEWRAAAGDVHEWAALSGEFTVDASGVILLPLLGSLTTAGRTPAELAATIGEALQEKVGLLQRPEASVQVVRFRPFYIVGDVDKPGEYAYRPGLSVLQAVSIAGGFYRARDPAAFRLARETIAAEGELRQHEAERLALVMRRARLEAETQDSEIKFSGEVFNNTDPKSVEQAQREERLIFEARRTALRSQVDALTQTKSLLGAEIETLRAKAASQERQAGLARRDLEGVNALAARGLAINPRQLASEQTLAQVETARLDTALALSRARQDIGKADRDVLDLRNRRRAETLAELRDTQTKLTTLVEKSGTARGLIYETEVLAPAQLRDREEAESQPSAFRLVRGTAGGTEELPVLETDAVEPGDVLKVLRLRREGQALRPSEAPSPFPSVASRTERGLRPRSQPSGGDNRAE